ncbi:MAG: hypothetical protein KatS3mg117_3352 [Geminicoccaceae bacterium]|nr:MAG: hypothetical protein KatS3mg117_3352 [Geminicoccaceae bacterium]
MRAKLDPIRWSAGAALAALLALASPAPRPVLAQSLDAQRAAAAVARVVELEEELRRLRGRIETLELERDELRERVERLEERLATLEGARPEPAPEPRPAAPVVSRGGPPPSTATAPSTPPAPVAPSRPSPPATAAPSPPAPPVAATRPQAPVEADLAARRGYVLGTIPREALLGTEPGPAATPGPTPSPAPASRPGQPGAAQPAPSQQAARTPPGGTTAAGRWAAARELLQKGAWEDAEEALRRFVEDFPNDPNAPTAAYWLGETFLVREDWQNAAATFARNYRTYGPEAPRAPDNLLKLGVALARLGDKEKACQTFAELDRRHPDASQAVRQALARERVAAGCA